MPNNIFEELLIGHAAELANTRRAAQMVALTDVTVLILGESGTGKELLAQAIHKASRRAEHPFISINCAALPENLVESELFGHRKGAFTGAVSDHIGRIQAAHHGTLFLDEIAELPLSVQAKLLRFLESGECQALGKNQAEIINTRILSATNADLHQKVQQGQFRADLYYRLNIVPLELPPLRTRGHDIALLIKTFTQQMAQQHRLAAPTYSRSAMQLLQNYTWVGNVRELRNLCERMVILHAGQVLEPTHLPSEIQQCQPRSAVGRLQAFSEFALPDNGINLADLEQHIIQQALHKACGNRSKAARLLGLTRDTLLYRIKKYAIDAY